MGEESRPNIAECLAYSQLFRGLPRNLLDELGAKLQQVFLSAGDSVFREDEHDNPLFLILSGKVKVLLPAKHRNVIVNIELGQGQSIGEIGFLTGIRRSATVTALTEAHLLRLSREDFDVLARQSPQLQIEVTNRIVQHLKRVHLSTALRTGQLLGSLQEDVLREVENELEFVSLSGGEILFRRDDPGNDLYLVINGRLRVVSTANTGGERVIAELGPGDTVGEMAALTGEPRAATVRAVRDSQLARLSRDGFQRLIAKHPEIVSKLFTRKLANLARVPFIETAGWRERARNFAVIAAGPTVSLQQFCSRTCEALSQIGTAFVLSSETVDSLLGRVGAAQASDDHAGQTRLTEYLNNLEAQFQYLLYQADANDSGWTRRCIRQGDSILLVADNDVDASTSSIEDELLLGRNSPKDLSLVLIHTHSAQTPSNTGIWLNARPGYSHHHIRLNSDGDFQRLTRFLTGNAVGLVLGGGFARGIAHVGAIRALEEANIPIDLIGGTSMGAMIAAMHAVGVAHERMVDIVSASATTLERDVTVPLISLNSGRGVLEAARSVVGDTQIEDLWIPFFCVSASLNAQTMKVHTRGSLLKSVLASTRVPGIYPPVVWGTDLLVDGGIANNLPVDVMKDFSNRGTVIAVDCSALGEPTALQEDYGLVVYGPRTLFRRLNPFGNRTKIPNIFNVLMRTILFGGKKEKEQARELADLYLQPPLQTFRFNDFRKGPEIADLAYRYSKRAIEEWINERSDATKIW
jgi:NTE family protein/lysophospholipid hydrolase